MKSQRDDTELWKKVKPGENENVDEDNENWRMGIHSHILKGYKSENIFKADTAVLLSQCLQEKELTFKNTKIL